MPPHPAPTSAGFWFSTCFLMPGPPGLCPFLTLIVTDAKCPQATTSSSVALTPPSGPPPPPLGSRSLHPPASWAAQSWCPQGSTAQCVYTPVPVMWHMCAKIYVPGCLLMYCLCDSKAPAAAQGAVSGGNGLINQSSPIPWTVKSWLQRQRQIHTLTRADVLSMLPSGAGKVWSMAEKIWIP